METDTVLFPPVRGEWLREPGPDDQRGAWIPPPPESLFLLSMDDKGPQGSAIVGGVGLLRSLTPSSVPSSWRT